MKKVRPSAANHTLPALSRDAEAGETVVVEPAYRGDSIQLVPVDRGWHLELTDPDADENEMWTRVQDDPKE